MDPPVKLGSLLAHPDSYHSKLVRIRGVVTSHQIKHIKQWMQNEDRCFQAFTVKDETGSIPASYGTSCSGAIDLLRIRDTVTLEGYFEESHTGGGVLNVETVISKTTASP